MAVTPDKILVHDAFVRGIARAILGRDPEVDDVVQETWIRALEAPPRETGSLRAWLRVVARNLSLGVRRSRVRRATRESERADPGPADPADEIIACEEIRGRLFRAVMALDEDYRTALVLRFYQGLPPRRIAARLGIPVETAKTRVKRGVAKLREQLDADDPANRGKWLGSLVLLADPVGRPSPDGVASLARLAGLVACGLLVCVGVASSRDPRVGVPASTGDGGDAPALVAVAPPPVVPGEPEALALAGSLSGLERPAGAARLIPPGPGDAEDPTIGSAPHPAALRGLSPIAGAPTSPEDRDRVESVGLRFRSVLGGTGTSPRPRDGEEAPLVQIELLLEGDLSPDVRFDLRFEGCPGGMSKEPTLLEDGRARAILWLRPGTYAVGGTDPETWVDPAQFRVGPDEPKVVILRVTRQVAQFALRPDEDRRPVHHLEDGTLILRRADGPPRRARSSVGPDGGATIAGLPPGEYVVRYTWPEGETVFLGTVVVSAGSSRYEFLVPAEAR